MSQPSSVIHRIRAVVRQTFCLTAVCLGAGSAGVGCSEDLQCGEGEELRDRACVPVAAQGGAPASGSTGGTPSADGGRGGDAGMAASASRGVAGESAAGAGGVDTGPAIEFGAVCLTDEECGDPAPFCAVQLGATTGICTATGCADDASVCPSGWHCLDLSQYGAPDICAED
ncbi:MAG: hypothetical protein JW751_09815 [Polyangiaceae bacterium]|nr:hypothetical protein [Polyangiaceae bacterium]